MKYIVGLILIGLLVFASCKKDTVEGTPPCIKENISDYEKSAHCSDARVDEYLFQAETVYVFEPGTCGADMSAPVLDAKCNEMGYLGGLMGNTKINGEEFSTATFIENVWAK